MTTTDKLAEAARQYLIATAHLGACPGTREVLERAIAEAEAKPAEPVAWTLQETLDKRETTCSARLWFTNPVNSAWAPLYAAPAAPAPHPDERADLAERIEAAHEASLDGDHRACCAILTECLKMLAFPKVAPMTGPKVAFWVYEWLHPTDGSVTLRSLRPEDHCRKPDRAIPVPLMDEWVQWAKAAAPAHVPEADFGNISDLLPGTYYMDPPDGGSVTLREQFERMATDAARYRWLRHGDNDEEVLRFHDWATEVCVDPPPMYLPRLERLDRLIDAARKEQTNG